MLLSPFRHRGPARALSCTLVLVTVFAATAEQAAAEMQWRRYRDHDTGLSLLYPDYWAVDTVPNEAEPELITTFLAPVTGSLPIRREPAAVEFRVVRTEAARRSADIRRLADSYEQQYRDKPQVYRALERSDITVEGRPAVQFSYSLYSYEGNFYVVEVWQAVDDIAVNLRLMTYAQFGSRELHYRSLFTEMAGSLVRFAPARNPPPQTQNLRGLTRVPEWADPRERSAIADHTLPRTFALERGLTVRYPDGWRAQPVYSNAVGEQVFFGREDDRLSGPFTVTVTDLYAAFIATAEDIGVRNRLTEFSDALWLEVVSASLVAQYEATVPGFELLSEREAELAGLPAVRLQYRGEGSGTRVELLAVDRRTLYSVTYREGTEDVRLLEKMADGVAVSG